MRKQQKKPEWQVEREVISRLMENYEKINVNESTRFSDFPLSKKTLKGKFIVILGYIVGLLAAFL